MTSPIKRLKSTLADLKLKAQKLTKLFSGSNSNASAFDGFTLAEVLITLAIIGVVAALTIPTVLRNYRNHETEVGLKKVYTELSQAINRSIAENGPMDKWDYATYSDNVNFPIFLDRYFAPYLKIQKNCYKNYNAKNCPEHIVTYPDSKTTGLAFYAGGRRNFVLNDGTMISFFGGPSQGYLYMFVDINGTKGPDKMGVDVFHFRLMNKKRLMFTCENCPNKQLTDDKGYGNYACSKKYNGGNCGAMIQRNGWKVPTKEEYVNKFGGSVEDYPW